MTFYCAAACSVIVGCAGSGEAVPARPASAGGGLAPSGAGVAPLGGAIRRTSSVGTCSSAGSGSFDGASANGNVAGGYHAVVGGGTTNLACDDSTAITGGVSNAIASGNNSYDSVIAGGTQNQIYGTATYSAIVGGYGNTVDPTNGNSVIVGGGAYNTGSSAGAALLGGTQNTASGFESALVGGSYVTVSGDNAFGGGGTYNTVSNQYAAIAGGEHNLASGQGSYIGGGGYNTASGLGAIVDGGFNSTVVGQFGTVPGGYVNSAGGTYSFAAGARASAPYTGNFVWSDGSDGDTILAATKAYQFLARASGGFTLYTNATSTVGAQLAAGSGSWASLSDRNAKTNIVPLDDAAVLDKVDALPISRWSYKTEHGVRHVGPMAQDFYAAFKVGADDKHITSIDEDGVALAAIRALHRDDAALHARLASLDGENARLRRQIAALKMTEAARDARDRRIDAALARLGVPPAR
ncbi:MAG TPA: tail fiber domain-containing protein [Candidatus Elarobacter sp.]|nr:tail fiber domain-containing protein [Candidatus Elarobacter sp.]